MTNSDVLESVGDTVISESTRSGSTTVPGVMRTTVLPRVEWAGPEPRVQPLERSRFEEIGLLGEGGMGEVTLARDNDIDREVAVKRLPPNCDLNRVLRFVEEIRIVGQLEHPNIMPVHDVGVDASGRYFFVMKRLEGDTLEGVINKLAAGDATMHARFPMEKRVQLFLSVLNAMAYAHQRGFIHRDLKPANIMVGPYGEVTVMDWGLARRFTSDHPELAPELPPRAGTPLQTMAGSLLGTPFYMSPEQARRENQTLDVRSDIYSLCVVFHELLHLKHYLDGRETIEAVVEGVLTAQPPLNVVSLGKGRDQVPAELDWFLERGLRKDKTQRWQTVSEMESELQRILRGECRVQCQRTFFKRMLSESRHSVDRHPILVIVGTTGLASLVLAAVVKSLMVLAG